MRETRLKIAKRMYAQGNKGHPYVKEFISELEPHSEEPAAQKRAKSKRKVYGVR